MTDAHKQHAIEMLKLMQHNTVVRVIVPTFFDGGTEEDTLRIKNAFNTLAKTFSADATYTSDKLVAEIKVPPIFVSNYDCDYDREDGKGHIREPKQQILTPPLNETENCSVRIADFSGLDEELYSKGYDFYNEFLKQVPELKGDPLFSKGTVSHNVTGKRMVEQGVFEIYDVGTEGP